MQWVEAAAGRRPDLAPLLAELGELYSRKLWHQLALRLEAALDDPALARGAFLRDLYDGFVAGFAHKINLLSLAALATAAAKQAPDPAAGLAFLRGVVDSLEGSGLPDAAGPALFLRMQCAQFQLVAGDAPGCAAALAAGEAALEALPDPDAAVSAAVHYAAMQLHKSRRAYAKFYKAALLHLAYAPAEGLPAEERLPLAVDVALAALLGEGVHNFGELLLHPLVGALREAPEQRWLLELLECFNAGDIAAYDALCARHAAVLNAQPALVEHERRLREKVTVAALLELLHATPPEARAVPLEAISARTKLPLDGVEFLLMKALALRLIEGSIDQVAGTVAVTWVAPRVLTPPQVADLRVRLDAWAAKAEAAAAMLEAGAVGVVAPA